MYEAWDRHYCAAYSDGHNNHGLRERRLDHYAHAYADICAEVRVEVPLGVFFVRWDAGLTYEGTENEHWYLGTVG